MIGCFEPRLMRWNGMEYYGKGMYEKNDFLCLSGVKRRETRGCFALHFLSSCFAVGCRVIY